MAGDTKVADDERRVIREVAQRDPNADEKALLAKVKKEVVAPGEINPGDPMNGKREGLRCRFPGGRVSRTYPEVQLGPDGITRTVQVERETEVGPCDTLIVVANDATESEVLQAIRARRSHEEGVHGYTVPRR